MAASRQVKGKRTENLIFKHWKLPTCVLYASVLGMSLWFFVIMSCKDSNVILYRYFPLRFVTYRNQKVEERLLADGQGTKMVYGIEKEQQSVSLYSSITRDKFPIINNGLKNYFLHINETDIVSSYKSAILAFVHNQKSGGTSIKRCLTIISRHQNKEPILVTNDNRAAIEEDILNGVSATKQNDIFVGAATFGVCENLTPRTCAYFTLLREPYERMISHYMFCRGGGKTALKCNNLTIEEFAISIGSILFTHITAHMSCRTSDSCNKSNETGPNGPWSCERVYSSFYDVRRQSVLGYVIENLDHFFAVIGLTEEYETSLAMFQEAFGLPFSDLCNDVHANTGTYRDLQGPYRYEDTREPQRHRYIEDMKRKMRANDNVRNSIDADLKIYERAREIFYKQKEIYLRTL